MQEGDRVRAGEPLMDGPSNPHDILSILGEKALHAYLVNEIQEVYRLQGVNINDAHRGHRPADDAVGEDRGGGGTPSARRQLLLPVVLPRTEFPRASGAGRRRPASEGAGRGAGVPDNQGIEEQVDRFRFMEENERVIANGGRPASACGLA